MANADPTAYERLHLLLSPPSSDAAAQRAVLDDPELKEASESYHTALGKTEDEARKEIRTIAERLSSRLGFSSQDIDNVIEGYNRTQTATFKTPAQAPDTQPQSQGITLPDWLKRDKKPNASEGVDTGDSGASPALRSAQEQELLDEFDKAIASGDEEEVKKLLEGLDAASVVPKLFDKQLEMLRKSIVQTDSFQKATAEDRERMLSELADQTDKKKREWQKDWGEENEKPDDGKPKTPEELLQEKRRREFQTEREKLQARYVEAHESGDKEKTRQAFHALASHRLNQVHSYVILEEYAPAGQALLLLELARAISQASAFETQQRAQEMQTRRAQAAEGASQDNNAGAFNAAKGLIGGRGEAAKDVVDKLAKSPAGAALAKAAGPYGEAARQLLIHRKLVKKLLLIGIIVAFAVVMTVLAGIVMLIIMIFRGQQNQQNQQNKLQVAKCIQTDTDTMSSVFPILSLIKTRFHVTIAGDLANPAKTTDATSLLAAKKLFTYTCMLFGHTSTDIGTNQLNTFGNYVTLPADGGLGVTINTTLSSSGQTCAASFVRQTGTNITWTLQDFASCSEGKGRFLTGKVYADIAVRQLRQEKIRNRQARQNTFDAFTVQFAGAKSLPTTNCSTTTGSAHSLACFSDLVGSYFSYPLYLDSTSSQTNFLTLVSDFANYYFFAKSNLFDNVEFFHVGHPTPPGYPADLRLAIAQTFGITMNGFPQNELKWAWDKLWDVSNTKFDALVKNGHVTMFSGNGTAYTTCGNGVCQIHLHEFGDEVGFDVIFIHELGHVISFMNVDSSSHRSGIPGAIVADIFAPAYLHGWMTYYSETACLYHPPTIGAQLNEDYAEMIAYYLNPKANMLTACGGGPNPYADKNHPVHFSLAQKILGLY